MQINICTPEILFQNICVHLCVYICLCVCRWIWLVPFKSDNCLKYTFVCSATKYYIYAYIDYFSFLKISVHIILCFCTFLVTSTYFMIYLHFCEYIYLGFDIWTFIFFLKVRNSNKHINQFRIFNILIFVYKNMYIILCI